MGASFAAQSGCFNTSHGLRYAHSAPRRFSPTTQTDRQVKSMKKKLQILLVQASGSLWC